VLRWPDVEIAMTPALILLFLSAGARASSTPMPLSSLVSPCHAMTTMVDHFGYPRLKAVLNCDGHAVRITGPDSLEGIVAIETPAAALEYVRFFSSERTYNLFDFGGVVEIAGFGKEHVTRDGRYLIPEEHRKFVPTIYHSPEVVEVGSNSGSARLFRIRRVVVATDGKIYDIEESVSGNGSYAILSRTVVFDNASRIGILHLGEI